MYAPVYVALQSRADWATCCGPRQATWKVFAVGWRDLAEGATRDILLAVSEAHSSLQSKGEKVSQ